MLLISSREHLSNAGRFDRFFAIIPDEYAEWKIIVLFYSALHYVEAFLVTKSTQYRDHTHRDLEMGRWAETRAIRKEYSILKKAAHEARYEGTPFRPADVADFVKYHTTIRDAMLQALNPKP